MNEGVMQISTRRPNQADIAARLGISISTVSRALAEDVTISEATRLQVQRVARDLGYKGKQAMLAEVLERRAVALVPLGSATSGISNFYYGIVEAMRSASEAIGLGLDVRLINEASVTLDLVRGHVAQYRANGLLLAGIDPSAEMVQWCRTAGIALVLVNGADPNMAVSSVAPANFFGAFAATQALLRAGHRKIMHYAHSRRPTLVQRRRGFLTAMAETAGAQALIVESNERTPTALAADILEGRHDITAIFCWNDIAAVQMLEALQGLDNAGIPGLSLIGFDDLPLAGMTTPRLSTVHVDREAIGRGAIALLQAQMDGETIPQYLQIGLQLVPGGTIRALPR